MNRERPPRAQRRLGGRSRFIDGSQYRPAGGCDRRHHAHCREERIARGAGVGDIHGDIGMLARCHPLGQTRQTAARSGSYRNASS